MDGGEHDLSDVGTVRESEDSLDLIVGHVLHDVDHVLVEFPAHLSQIREDERFVHIESQSDDVFSIFDGQPLCVRHFQVFPEEFLVVRQLDDQRNVKRLLQPSGN